MTTTNLDNNGLKLGQCRHQDETCTFAGTETWLEGTLLARNSATGKVVPVAVGGANDTATPRFVLASNLTKGSAGDIQARPICAGEVNAERLILHADGDNSNITPAILDTLRANGITALYVQRLSGQDNQ